MFTVLRDRYWICRASKDSVSEICVKDVLAVVYDIAGTVTIVSKRAVGECIGPYYVLASEVLDPSTVGFLAKVSTVLASADVPVMVYSSIERDYILVPCNTFEKAVQILQHSGFIVQYENQQLS